MEITYFTNHSIYYKSADCFYILENMIEYQPCVLFLLLSYPVEKTESQESLLPSQFCSFLSLAAKNNSHHFHKEDSFFSVGPSFFLITGEPEAGGPWPYQILQIYTVAIR